MGLFQKDWTPVHADEWTVHDLMASVFAALSYILVAVGVGGTLLLQAWGFITLILGIACIVLMYLVIDPKLKAMSDAFAERQQEFIDLVEKTTKWEDREWK